MQKERWLEIISNIKDKFEIEDEGNEHLEEDGGVDIEYIVFNGPLGKIRLEYITEPLILDKKTKYSRRIGSETSIKYVYSDTEKSSKFIAYKWNQDDSEWEEIESKNFI